MTAGSHHQTPTDNLTRGSVAALIVSYNPSVSGFQALIDSLVAEGLICIIIDNGSTESPRCYLKLAEDWDLKFKFLGENLGIAAAQNRGIALAREMGAEAVILFDQDSLPPPGMVKRLTGALNELEAQGQKVAAIGPRPVDARLPSGQWPDPVRGGIERVDHLIASGTLIPLSAFDAVGPMREELFIDYVDTEWCLRAASKGYGCYRVNDIAMAHEFGTPIRVFGRAFVSHTPMRHYYLFRNSIWLWRQGWVPLGWKLSRLPRLILRLGFNVLFARPHGEQWRMMARGMRDGVLGRTGRGHDRPARRAGDKPS